jgi:succinate dehydrogenase / fumarate reductase flavoprotein subunit
MPCIARSPAADCYVAAWEYQGTDKAPLLHQEPLAFENVHLSTRSYK